MAVEENTTMLTIKVLGPNSPHTDKLESFARAAVRMLNPHNGYEIIRVTDENAINTYVDMVPSLVINENVVAEGALPAPQLIVTWASDAMQTALETAQTTSYAYQDALAAAAR